MFLQNNSVAMGSNILQTQGHGGLLKNKALKNTGIVSNNIKHIKGLLKYQTVNQLNIP